MNKENNAEENIGDLHQLIVLQQQQQQQENFSLLAGSLGDTLSTLALESLLSNTLRQ